MTTTMPKHGQAEITFDKPPIWVTSWDHFRLSAVVDAFRLRGCEDQVELLAEELDRAELVEPAAVPPDVVTMHSCATIVDHDADEVRRVTLVYPGGGQPPGQGRHRHPVRQRAAGHEGGRDGVLADPERPDQAPVGARGGGPAGEARARRSLRPERPA